MRKRKLIFILSFIFALFLLLSVNYLFVHAEDNLLLSPDWWKDATPQMVESAISDGADVNDKDIDGITPLMYAARHNQNPQVIETLIKCGANVNSRDDADGDTPLMYAARGNENPQVIETLIKYGANVKERTEKPKLLRIIKNRIRWKGLLEIKNVGEEFAYFLQDRDRKLTPLMYAAENNQNPQVVETLIKCGADVKERDVDGETPLMQALYWNQNPQVVETLIKCGADVNDRDINGATPLILTVLSSIPIRSQMVETQMVEILVKYGADVRAKDNFGLSALDYAKEHAKERPEIYRWLLDNKMYE